MDHEQVFALALTPDSPETWNNLGNALQHLYRLNEAESAYRQALALKPNFADAWYNLGTVRGSIGIDTNSFAEYETLALRLASEPMHLRAIKHCLLENRAFAPLFDAPKTVRNLERAYLQMLMQWIAGNPAISFDVSATH